MKVINKRYHELYHGTIQDFVEQINKSKILKSAKAGAQKISSGFVTESDLVWVTPYPKTAEFYASGGEASFLRPQEYGGVFVVKFEHPLKLINRYHKLNAEECKILNNYIPDYKPVKPGDSLSTAVDYRMNGKHTWGDILRILGYNGIFTGSNETPDVQIGIASDTVEIHGFLDKEKISQLLNNNL